MKTSLELMLWHPVVALADLQATPVAVTLLGEPLVLWRDGEGRAHAWTDRCPHRGARLSLGQVVESECGVRHLACPYHGWQFAPGGQCVHVPARPDWTPPPGHAAGIHDAQEAHGLLWVRLVAPDAGAPLPDELTRPPPFEPGSLPGWRSVVCGPYAVATSAPRLVENFLDMSHFGFVHSGWLGGAAHAQVEVGHIEETATGVRASNCRAWQPQGYAGADGGQFVAYDYAVLGPYAATLQKNSVAPDGPRNAIALFINPVHDEACTAWFVMSTVNDPSTDESLRAFQDAVFAQDRPVVESQTPVRLPIHKGSSVDTGVPPEVHGPADRLSAAYRRCLVRWGVTVGVC